MYLIVIGWVYVVLMMSVAEATNSNGTLLGALLTFVLYGVGPVSLVVYLMGAPTRNKAIKERDAMARSAQTASAEPVANSSKALFEPHAGGHSPGGAETVAAEGGVAPMRKEP